MARHRVRRGVMCLVLLAGCAAPVTTVPDRIGSALRSERTRRRGLQRERRVSDGRPRDVLSDPVPRRIAQPARPGPRRPSGASCAEGVGACPSGRGTGAALRLPGSELHARRLPRAPSRHRAADRPLRHDPRRTLPVRQERPASLHLVVDGEDGHRDARRHRDCRGTHSLGRRPRGRVRARPRGLRVRTYADPPPPADVVGRPVPGGVLGARRRLATRARDLHPARRRRRERGDAVQRTCGAERHEVLVRLGRDAGAGPGAACRDRPSGRRVPPGEDLAAHRRRGRRDLAHRQVRPGSDVLLPQRGSARLCAARPAARARRQLAWPPADPGAMDPRRDDRPRGSAASPARARPRGSSATGTRRGSSPGSACSHSSACEDRRSTSIRKAGS